MKFPITKAINVVACIVICSIILCADGLMNALNGWFLPVCILLMTTAYGALALTEKLGHRYIWIGCRKA